MERIYLHFTVLFFCLTTNSQELPTSGIPLITMNSLNASCGEASSSTGSIVYSIGTIFYTNLATPDNSVAPSIQQAKEISLIEADGTESDKIVAYPNPTTSHLVVEIQDYNVEKAQYQLYDATGRLLKNGQITDPTTALAVDDLRASTYLLRITLGHKVNQTFKIIKQ